MSSVCLFHCWLFDVRVSVLTWCILSSSFSHDHCWLWVYMRKNVDEMLNCGNSEWRRGDDQRIWRLICHDKGDIPFS